MTQPIQQILLPGTEADDRADFIGGSDAHHVLGLEPWGCPRALVLEKGQVPPDVPRQTTKDMDRGKLLEPVMRQLFMRDTGLHVAQDGPVMEAMAQWAQAPGYLRVHLDGLISPPTPAQWAALGGTGPAPDGPGVYEGKVPRSAGFWPMKRDGPKLGYLAQVLHGQIITGTRWGVTQASEADGLNHLRWLVQWDDGFAADYLAAASRLWAQAMSVRALHVGDLPTAKERHAALESLPDLPPRLPAHDSRCRRCPHRITCQDEAYMAALDLQAIGTETMLRMDDSPEWQQAVARIREFEPVLEEAKMQVEAGKDTIKFLMGTGTLAQGAGARVTYRSHDQKRVDGKLLEAKFPDVFKQVTKKVPQRPLLITLL